MTTTELLPLIGTTGIANLVDKSGYRVAVPATITDARKAWQRIDYKVELHSPASGELWLEASRFVSDIPTSSLPSSERAEP